jgi:dTMP kinase
MDAALRDDIGGRYRKDTLAGVFVTFEGPEGAGKSTALKAVAAALQERGHEVLCTREPGAGELGRQIRELLLHGENLPTETELLLFLADRANHIATIVRPALGSGKMVLCDRHADSTLAYQGYGRGSDVAFLRSLNRYATRGLVPDLTVLFDLEPEIGLARLTGKDRLDSEPMEFHRRVRAGFLRIAEEEPKRFRIVDASKDAEVVAVEVAELVLARI